MARLVADDRFAADREIDANSGFTSIARYGGGVAVLTLGESDRNGGAPLRATIYDADGAQVGATILVATGATTGFDVVGLNNGRFAVAWADGQGRTSPSTRINTQVFDYDGNAVGAAAVVATNYTTQNPRLTANTDGSFVVGWLGSDIVNQQVFARAVSADNVPLGTAPIQLGATGFNDIDTLADGRTVVTYRENATGGFAVRVLDPASGFAPANLITVTPGADAVTASPSATLLASGNLLVTWAEGSSVVPYAVRGQVYSPAGIALADSFTIPLGVLAQTFDGSVETAALDGGGFVVTYRANPGDAGSPLLAQVFGATAAAVGAQFEVDGGGQDSPRFVSVTGFGTDDLAIAYTYSVSGAANDASVRLYYNTTRGTDGPDTLSGTPQRDIILGLGGDDTLYGQGGNDVLIGGPGADLLQGSPNGSATADYGTSPAAVTVSLGSGTPSSGGDAEGDRLVFIRNLVGSAFADTLAGDGEANRIDGGAGADTMSGGYGNDTYIVDDAADRVIEVADLGGLGLRGGFDTIVTSVAYTAPDLVEQLVLAAGGLGTLTANLAGTRLVGNERANLLVGRAGSDVLVGGLGADTLTGGGGNDAFVDSGAGLDGDTITDFGRGDRITVLDALPQAYTAPLFNGVVGFSNAQVRVTAVQGRITFRAEAGGGVTASLAAVAQNDFGGEGFSDILWRNAAGAVTDWTSGGGYAFNMNAQFYRQVGLEWTIAGTGDFSGDGRTDILWRHADGTVTDWFSNGTTFVDNAALNRVVPLGWQIAGTGDFNGDARDDILWRNVDGTVTNWLSTGTGFADNPAGTTVVSLDWKIFGTGDFNGDGRSDILWRNDDGRITTWTATENQPGGFISNVAAALAVGADWHISGTGDFNGDGRTDILWRNDAGVVTTWTANGASFAGSTSFYRPVGLDWSIADTGDYNGDGRDDILWRNVDGTLTQWLSNGASFNDTGQAPVVPVNWQVQTPAPVRESALFASADFNGDGKDDLLWRNSNGTITDWLSNGSGFADNSAFNRAVSLDWRVAGTGDFNGDGRDDILWRNVNGTVTNWLASGTGFQDNTGLNRIVAAAWKIEATGDFNGDGRDDILWRNNDGTLTNWFSTGAGFTDNATLNRVVPAGWHIEATGDFNGDGRDDILWRHADGTVTDWFSTGTGFADNAALGRLVSLDWQIVGAGDFNGDGRDDILWRNANGTVTDWLSNGSGFTDNAGLQRVVPLDWTITGIGDYDGDGRDDIAWRNADGTVIDWLSNGTGTGFTDNNASVRSVALDWHLQTGSDFPLF